MNVGPDDFFLIGFADSSQRLRDIINAHAANMGWGHRIDVPKSPGVWRAFMAELAPGAWDPMVWDAAGPSTVAHLRSERRRRRKLRDAMRARCITAAATAISGMTDAKLIEVAVRYKLVEVGYVSQRVALDWARIPRKLHAAMVANRRYDADKTFSSRRLNRC